MHAWNTHETEVGKNDMQKKKKESTNWLVCNMAYKVLCTMVLYWKNIDAKGESSSSKSVWSGRSSFRKSWWSYLTFYSYICSDHVYVIQLST